MWSTPSSLHVAPGRCSGLSQPVSGGGYRGLDLAHGRCGGLTAAWIRHRRGLDRRPGVARGPAWPGSGDWGSPGVDTTWIWRRDVAGRE